MITLVHEEGADETWIVNVDDLPEGGIELLKKNAKKLWCTYDDDSYAYIISKSPGLRVINRHSDFFFAPTEKNVSYYALWSSHGINLINKI